MKVQGFSWKRSAFWGLSLVTGVDLKHRPSGFEHDEGRDFNTCKPRVALEVVASSGKKALLDNKGQAYFIQQWVRDMILGSNLQSQS
jgi:hypothetical protein